MQYFHIPSAVDDTEQLDYCKLSGVICQSICKMDWHIQSSYHRVHSECTYLIFCVIRVFLLLNCPFLLLMLSIYHVFCMSFLNGEGYFLWNFSIGLMFRHLQRFGSIMESPPETFGKSHSRTSVLRTHCVTARNENCWCRYWWKPVFFAVWLYTQPTVSKHIDR